MHKQSSSNTLGRCYVVRAGSGPWQVVRVKGKPKGWRDVAGPYSTYNIAAQIAADLERTYSNASNDSTCAKIQVR